MFEKSQPVIHSKSQRQYGKCTEYLLFFDFRYFSLYRYKFSITLELMMFIHYEITYMRNLLSTSLVNSILQICIHNLA